MNEKGIDRELTNEKLRIPIELEQLNLDALQLDIEPLLIDPRIFLDLETLFQQIGELDLAEFSFELSAGL